MSESTRSSTNAWAARGMQALPGLSPRPQHHCVSKKGGVETINSDKPSLFVFVKDCEDLTINVIGKVGKITLENGKGLVVNVGDNVVGGTLEVIRCQNTSLKFAKDAVVPIVQVDDSANISVSIFAKYQLESMILVRTKCARLFLENQQVEEESGLTLEYEIKTPVEKIDIQRIAHWSSALPDANFITEPIVRDGIYPTTAEIKKASEENREKMITGMGAMLMQGVKISKPDKSVNSSGNSNDKNLDNLYQ